MDNPAVQPHLTSRLSPFCAVWVLIVSSSASLRAQNKKAVTAHKTCIKAADTMFNSSFYTSR